VQRNVGECCDIGKEKCSLLQNQLAGHHEKKKFTSKQRLYIQLIDTGESTNTREIINRKLLNVWQYEMKKNLK